MLSMRAAVAIVVLPSVLAGVALAAQDRYSLQVPGGLAFADFRGYEDWQVVAVSHNGDKLAIILGNPVLIEAYRAGVPGNGKPFPDGARFAKIHWTEKNSPTAAEGDTPSSTMIPPLRRSNPATKTAPRRRSTTPNAGSPATRS